MKGVCVLFVTFLVFKFSAAYKAAVIEHYPYADKGSTADEIIKKNLQDYQNYIAKAKGEGANIIVFPEYGLTTLVDDPKEYAINVNDSDTFKKLKVMAVENGMYLVVNILEKDESSSKNTEYYNTNLVFDRNGELLLKYRKINLFNEKQLTPGSKDQSNTFKTDFGVTFGIFTSFDILFENPSKTVFIDTSVTDIVFPTAWFATMPFFTGTLYSVQKTNLGNVLALSVQHGYAVANGVNLLAANYGNPKSTHGGSGIYLGDGKVPEMYIADTPSNKAIVQEVPKLSKREDKTNCPKVAPRGLPSDLDKSNVTNYRTDYVFKASDYTFKKIDMTQSNATTSVCDGSLCCTFQMHINTSETKSINVYKVMAYDGPMTYGNSNIHVRVCSLVACETDSDDTCGKRVEVDAKFTKITVKGKLTTCNEGPTYFAPVTLNTFLQPLTETTYCNFNATDSTSIELTTTKAQQNVLVFGILGQVSASASLFTFSVLFLTMLSVIKCIVV